MKRLVSAVVVGFGCLSSACSEDAAGWLGDLEGVEVGRADEGVSSPVSRRRQGLDDGELELARAFFPELAPRPGRLALDPVKLLQVTVGGDEMEIATRGLTFRIRRLSGQGRPFWQPVDGEGADGRWRTSRIDEYVVTRAGAGPHRERFEVTVPDDVVALRDAGDYLEFVDTEGIPALRMHHAVARDEEGRWRRGRATVWGAVPAGVRGGLPAFALRGKSLQVELDVGLEGFAGTVVVDPGWSSTSGMSVGRAYFTQTLMPSGKVLVAGGCCDASSSSAFSSTELYDPASGTWQATGTMSHGRELHAAALLQDGRVLVAGGALSWDVDGTHGLSESELYDPATGTWQETGLMVRARDFITASLLPSGKVLVVGRADSEVYDPVTATWDLTGPMVYQTSWGMMALLPSGRVLATSGAGGGGYESQIYDPATNTWSATGSMAKGRYLAPLTVLSSGKVLVVAGRDPRAYETAACELYDPATGAWSPAGDNLFASWGMTSALLPSGKILVMNGVAGEIYNPTDGTWRSADSSPHDHTDGTATLLPSGKVMVALRNNPMTDVYDPRAGVWTVTAAQATARSGASVTQLPGGKVLIAGGQGASGPMAATELYDPATRAWLPTGWMTAARSRHTATLLPTGAVLVVGGDGPAGALASAELYDPVSGTWGPTSPLINARSSHTATLLPNGAVLVAGGSGAGSLSSAELYDPGTGTWMLARPMGSSRAGHTATPLSSGIVLVAGGQASSGPLASTELYDPGLDTWSPGPTLATARTGHTATLLPSGRVLIAGGQDATAPLASTEVYLPASGTWRAGGLMAAARSDHTATMLPGGKVLVAAGRGTAGPLAAAEVYDEASDAWTPASALATARADAAAILLTSGRVLVAGGSAASGSLSSAELYEDTGASDAWRPSFAAIPPLYTGEVISVSGSRFRGLSEGSNGSWAGNSPANVPVVQLLPLQGGALPVPVQSFSDTSLTLTIPSVSEGYYLLSVTVNAIPVAAVVFIDGPPAAPVLTAPGPVVASSRPLIAGIAEAGSTVTVSLDGSSLGAASTDSSGAWSIIPASALMDGPHVIAARATDAIGAAGAWSPPRSFTVDTMAPASPVLTDPGTFTGTRPVLSGTSEPASRVTLRVDGVVAGTTGASATGQWSVGIASPLAEGLHAATAQAEDAAGNSSPISAARSFTVDSVPPPPPVIVSPGSGASISSRTPVISGTAEGNSSVTVAVDGYLVGVAVADASGAWSCQSTLSFTQGAHSLTAQAQDAAGNQGPATSPSLFTVDSTPPAPPILLTPAESAIESSDTPLISGTAEVGSRVTVWLDGVSAGATGTTDSGTWSFFPSSPLETGPHTVLVQATDAAGNDSSTTGVRSFTVQPPTPMVPQILSPNGIVATAFPRITGRAGSEDSVDVLVDGALAGTASTDQTGSWSLAISSALADGQHSAAARARDARLNASPLSSPVTFVVDTIAPPAPWLETPGAGALLKDAAPELAGSAEPGSTVSVVLDSEVTGTPKAGESGAWTFTPPKPLADGLHTVTLQATDAAGNVSPPSDLRSFTVQRPRSFYGSGCSAAPSRSLGAWWLLLALCAMASRRRRRQRVPGLQGRQPRLLPLYRTLLGINMDLTSAALGIQGGTVCVVSERLVAGAGPGGGG